MRLVLASASPRRTELLAAAGFSFETLAVDVDERPEADEPPSVYVRRLAGEKSARALERLVAAAAAGAREAETAAVRDTAVLGADTAVVVDGRILGKPRNDREARAMLERLAGRRHEVMTGVSLRSTTDELHVVETTAVWFAPLGADEIAWYVASGEGRDKAGAYAIQGLAARFIPRIEGSHSNVVGLPVARVHELVKRLQEGSASGPLGHGA